MRKNRDLNLKKGSIKIIIPELFIDRDTNADPELNPLNIYTHRKIT